MWSRTGETTVSVVGVTYPFGTESVVAVNVVTGTAVTATRTSAPFTRDKRDPRPHLCRHYKGEE